MGGYPPPGEVSLSDVKIPKENLLGEINKGFYQTMDWLDKSRSFVATYALGVAQGAFDLALEYSKSREQFGQPISNFQDIQFKLADMAIKVEAARLMCYRLCDLEDKEIPHTQFASMAKLFTSEAAEEIASDAVMIHGAYGTSTEYPIHKYYACAKVSQVIEGTSQIHRGVIAKRLLK
jgi:butyryl-CoA dehydrogenase